MVPLQIFAPKIVEFGEKIVAKFRVGFRVRSASECEQRKTKRDAKNARRAFFVLKGKARSAKFAAKIFSSFCEKSNENANKTLLHEKKAFFSQNFFTKLRKSPYFLGKKRCLLKKGILVGRISSRFFQKPNTPFIVSYACITFSASWVALCCWGSPSPRRCAPVRPPHGGAFAPSGRTLTGVGARPCKRRKKRLHAYACEAVVHPTDIQ